MAKSQQIVGGMMTCKTCNAELSAREIISYGSWCENCFALAALKHDRIDYDRKMMTATEFNVPVGMSIARKGRQPGTGEGNDFFGNHT